MFTNIKYIKKSILLLISVFSFTMAQAQSGEKSDILILNAYNQDVKWTSEITDTIKKQLTGVFPQLKISTENLHYNEYPTRNNIDHKLGVIIRHTGIPKIAILIGDEANNVFHSVLKYTPGWENVKSISVTTNQSIHSKDKNSTEIEFKIQAQENINLIQNTVDNLDEILVIDKKYSYTGAATALLQQELATSGSTAKIKRIILTRGNADSVYNIMLENKPGRAILTYTWNLTDKNSSYTKDETDSLFSVQLTTPVFSVFPNDYNNNYLIGGYNLSTRVCSEKVVENTRKIIDGTPPASIAAEAVKNGDITLNGAALKKFEMENAAKKYFEVRHVNTPKSLLEQYQYELAISLVVLIVLIIFSLNYYKKYKTINEQRDKVNEIKSRYTYLTSIYENINMNFAIYGIGGEKLFELINTPNHDDTEIIKDFLPDNLFKNSFITKDDINHIKGKRILSREYSSNILKKDSNKNQENPKMILLVIRAMLSSENEAYKYILTATAITNTNSHREEKEALNHLIKDAAEITDIGVASYNILTGKGFATENWYNNLGEKHNGDSIQPSYSNCSIEEKVKILDFKQNLLNATATKLGIDIRVRNAASGKERWIRENIFLHEYDPKNGIIQVIEINFDIHKEKVKEVNFINLNAKAERANHDNDKFIGNISHEIRTPLTSIMGFSNMLTTLSNTKDRVEIVNIIKRNNVMLIELVNNILSISKIDSGTYHFEKTKVELNEFFQELKIATAHMIATESLLTDKKLEIICDIPAENHIIVTDEWNFRQVMINLLSNAVKFTSEGTIIFGYQPQEDGTYFYVKDSGCGIAQENQDKIFGRFEKFDIHTHGTGLGLSLCKSIITHLNGEIGVISKEGEGSTFWFVLKNESQN